MSIFSTIRSLFSRPQPLPDAEWIIVGLGNPGDKYASTRHNVGYMAVDALLEGTELRPAPDHIPALVAQVGNALVVRSMTYMNNSGEAVAPLVRRLNIPPERIVVIHDELDLKSNQVKLRQGGNENGHNGLKSLSAHLESRDYLRVRIGIARPPRGTSVPDYVLAPLEDEPALRSALSRAARGAQLITTEGLAQAQNIIHSEH